MSVQSGVAEVGFVAIVAFVVSAFGVVLATTLGLGFIAVCGVVVAAR